MRERFHSQNARISTPAIPAILLREPLPGAFLLEKHGVTSGLCVAMGELASAISCYAETRLDAGDLKDAAARFFDVANRIDRRARSEQGAANDR